MKTHTIDKYYKFDRNIGYTPIGYFTTEDEIRALCKKNRIVVQNISKMETYVVTGTKVRSHKDCEKLQEALNTLK